MASFLSTLFGGGAEREAADRNRQLLSQYQTGGNAYLDKGLASSTGALTTGYDAARGDYAPLANLAGNYRGGSDLYLNALGVNGADAARTAQSSFVNNPGYGAAITAGLDAINRRRAAAGMLGSGNADQDAQVFGQNLQNQQYGSWLDRLAGINNNALTATGAVSQGTAGLDVGQGTGLAGLYSSDADARTNILGSTTSGGMAANNQQAAGESAGARNLLGAGLSLASLAAGGGFGFGGAGATGASNLGSFFSSGGSNPFLPNGARNTLAYGFG